MPEITTLEIREYLANIQGREITLNDLRKEFNILAGSKSFNSIRTIMFQLAEQHIVKPTGKKDGSYKVVVQVKPVRVFAPERERIPPVNLIFPRAYDTRLQLTFAADVVIRQGDLILISGLSNYGKTTLCLNFLAENLDTLPVLMGNEYTTWSTELNKYIPHPRMAARWDAMDWVQWIDGDLNDRFILLPVRDDYAENIIKDKINIIDWINIETGEHYMIGNILESIKKQLGKGVGIIAIQKAEGADAGRGGQFTKDFADLELLLDKYGENEVLLKIGKAKEPRDSARLTGRVFGYTIEDNGNKIMHFRELRKCPDCNGDGYSHGKPCERCWGRKFIDK